MQEGSTPYVPAIKILTPSPAPFVQGWLIWRHLFHTCPERLCKSISNYLNVYPSRVQAQLTEAAGKMHAQVKRGREGVTYLCAGQ